MFLVAQSTYDQIELAIFQDNICLKELSISKMDATKLLIPELDKLLYNLDLRLSNLDFIAAGRGPAPFTTLRVLLSTLNGISLATNIPLISINTLDTLLNSNLSSRYQFTLVLLNAFSDDVYYALKTPEKKLFGCKNINLLVTKIKNIIKDEKIKIVGNGVSKFYDQIKKLNLFIPDKNPEYTTLKEVAATALQKWKQKETTTKILPIYLKEAVQT